MTSLQDTLSALSTGLPELPAQISDLITEGNQAAKTARDLLEAVVKRRGEAGEFLTELQQVLAEVTASAQRGKEAVDNGVATLHQTFGEARSALESQEQEIGDDTTHGADAMDALQVELAEAEGGAKQGSSDVQEAVQDLTDVLKRGQEDLEGALDGVHEEFRAVEQAVVETQNELVEGAHGLADAIRTSLAQGRERVQTTLARLHALQAELEGRVQEEQQQLSQSTEALEQTVRETLEKDVEQRITMATGALLEATDELARTASEAEAEARAQAQALSHGFSTLKQTMEPLPGAVDQVKRAAQELGLSWS